MIGETSTSKSLKRVTVVKWPTEDCAHYSLVYRGRTYFEKLACVDDIDARAVAIDHLRAASINVLPIDVDVVINRRRG